MLAYVTYRVTVELKKMFDEFVSTEDTSHIPSDLVTATFAVVSTSRPLHTLCAGYTVLRASARVARPSGRP